MNSLEFIEECEHKLSGRSIDKLADKIIDCYVDTGLDVHEDTIRPLQEALIDLLNESLPNVDELNIEDDHNEVEDLIREYRNEYNRGNMGIDAAREHAQKLHDKILELFL